MSKKTIAAVLSQVRDLNTLCMYFENEPFSDPEFVDKVDFAVQVGCPQNLEISTNVHFVTKLDVIQLERILKHIKHDIRISFHGHNKESYEHNMGLPFDVGLKKARMLLDSNLNVTMWCAYKGRHPGYQVGMDVDLGEFRKLFDGYPVHFFKYHDRAQQNLESTKPKRCVRQFKWVHVLWNGDVILCCMDYHKETFLGNVHETPLREILSKRKPMPICGRCISPGG